MRQIELGHCFGDVAGFGWVKLSWRSFSHGAKATVACADVPSQHESRRAIGPTLKNIRTAGLLTYGVQVQPFDEL
jgi:hypothetical protein